MDTVKLHPSFGIRRLSDAKYISSMHDRALLATHWESLDEDERDDFGIAFVHEVVTSLVAGRDASFAADLPLVTDRAPVIEALTQEGLHLPRDSVEVHGALSPNVLKMLLSSAQVVLTIEVEGEEKVHIHDDVEQVVLTMSCTERARVAQRVTAVVSRLRRRARG